MYAALIEEGPPLPVSVQANPVAALLRAGRDWQVRLGLPGPPFEVTESLGGVVNIRARHVSGFIRVGDLSIEVVPKYFGGQSTRESRASLWKLLMFAHPLFAPRGTTSGEFDETTGLADLLAELFLNSVRTAHLQGLPLRYEERPSRAQVLRGRLDLARLDDLYPFRGVLPLLVDELTANTAPNQLLNWTARALEPEVSTGEMRLALRRWRSDMPREVAAEVPRGYATLVVGEQHANLRPALRIGAMLANDRQANFGEGTLDLPGFLWKSSSLFEGAVARLFREAAAGCFGSVEKRTETFLMRANETASVMTPDLQVTWRDGGRLLFDAKYKMPGSAPAAPDAYQVVAAGRRLGVQIVGLVYPSSEHGLETASFDVPGFGPPSALVVGHVGLQAFAQTEGITKLRAQIRDWLVALKLRQDAICAAA